MSPWPASPCFPIPTSIRAANGGAATYRAPFRKKPSPRSTPPKVDLVLIAGDLTQSGLPEECGRFSKTLTKQLRPPVYFVPGNHDVGHKFNSGQTNGTITPERVCRLGKKPSALPGFSKKARGPCASSASNSSLLGSGLRTRKPPCGNLSSTKLARPHALPDHPVHALPPSS